MANTEDDILKEAIAGTELEIFSEAVGKDLPSTEGGAGDRSVEEMGDGLEGQLEATTDENVEAEAVGDGDAETGNEAEEASEGDGKTAAAKDPRTGQFVKAKTEGDAKTGDKKGSEVDPDADLLEADGKPKLRVPASELVKQRKATRAAEARVRELEAKPATVSADEVQRLIADGIAKALQTQQKPPQQEAKVDAPATIDIFDDPEAWKAATAAGIEKALTQKYVAADFQRTSKSAGDKFTAAYTAITAQAPTDPAVRAEIQKIWNSATPGDDLLAWHAKQEVQRLIGDDPEAYKLKIETETREKLANDPEFRKLLLKGLQEEARTGEGGTPRHVARMPKSLNSAAGGQGGMNGAGATVDGSDRGVFDAAFQQ